MTPPQTIHLPNGATYTVTPVFEGFFFKSPAHADHHHHGADHLYPAGWTIVLRTDDGDRDGYHHPPPHTFTRPTLQADRLFISSVSYPSSRDFQSPPSATRHMAMMLWVTLHWYFHQQPVPAATLAATERSQATPDAGRPRGEWRVRVEPSGILGGHMLARLERMGLLSALDTAVWRGGIQQLTDRGDTAASASSPRAATTTEDMWINDMFISQSMFWQLSARQFLFTLAPACDDLPPYSTSPPPQSPEGISSPEPSGPFFSASHLPTYFPPPPPHFVMTDGVRHPLRPRPPHMGEVFYSRFIPSVGQYLSLRVASASPDPVPYAGPKATLTFPRSSPEASRAQELATLSDAGLLRAWLGMPRVSAAWGGYSAGWVETALASTNSFPVIGLWDGVPFGYFEVYWVLEDGLGRLLVGPGCAGADAWDRGVHALVGEDWARGRVQAWLTSLVHYAFEADPRTMSVCIEPRVDNARFIRHLQAAGFNKEREVTFPHKQAWFGRLRRDGWQGPAL